MVILYLQKAVYHCNKGKKLLRLLFPQAGVLSMVLLIQCNRAARTSVSHGRWLTCVWVLALLLWQVTSVFSLPPSFPQRVMMSSTAEWWGVIALFTVYLKGSKCSLSFKWEFKDLLMEVLESLTLIVQVYFLKISSGRHFTILIITTQNLWADYQIYFCRMWFVRLEMKTWESWGDGAVGKSACSVRMSSSPLHSCKNLGMAVFGYLKPHQ